ncbi:MAG: GHKL domain-containing protein [Phycisphaerae bacterium]|nr:GHKL domain-containing protein [Gemmatimonadaceae bacterium]
MPELPDELIPYIRGLAEEMWESSGHFVSNSRLAVEPETERAKVLYRYSGVRAFVVSSIGLGEEVIGTIFVGTLTGSRDWTESEVDTVDRAAAFLAQFIVKQRYIDQLSEHVERLERLDRQKATFVATVSHELRTPLTIVGGYAETLVDDSDVPVASRHAFLQTILSNTRRMQRIVDDLLDLSRIESGGWRPNPIWSRVPDVVADVMIAVKPAADEKASVVRADIPRGFEKVFADPTALRQVLGNLVENAVRHTADGTVTVVARREGAFVTLAVTDTGIGIPAEHLPRIFERFYRVDPARSREQGGTGLGLAIVRHLVEAHGGNVTAESEAGVGTTIVTAWPVPVTDL